MIHQSNLKSVPTIPAAWQKAAAYASKRGLGEMRLAEDDDFEGGRNWAMIILFSAMSIVPLGLVCLAF